MKVFILWSLFLFSDGSNDRQLVSEYTCSFDFATCGGDAWCDTSRDTCDRCKGEYVLIEELDKRTCIPRWHGCNDHPDDGSQSDPCCGISECVDYNEYSKGCEVHYFCCSSNQFHCLPGGDEEWCNGSDDNCQVCEGYWIEAFGQLCTAMWNPCSSTAECCGSSECLDNGNGSMHCNVKDNEQKDTSSCCSWDQGTCSEDVWCDETSGNCQECGGYWIDSDNLNGCLPMWNECTSTSECCGDAECLEDRIGWKHCNTAANLVLPDTCCSWDQGFCTGDEWCDQTSNNCQEDCGGFWIFPPQLGACLPMWFGCYTSDECCGSAECLVDEYGWNHCNTEVILPENCCSWDQGICAGDEYCDESSVTCEDCGGYWISPPDLNGCAPMWKDCSSTADCCGDAKCLDDGNGWIHCDIDVTLGPPPTPVAAPSWAPIPDPTPAPVPNPTQMPVPPPTPPPVPPPTPTPVLAPTLPPTPPPTPPPTLPPVLSPTLSPLPPPTPTPDLAPTLAPVPPPTPQPGQVSTPPPITPIEGIIGPTSNSERIKIRRPTDPGDTSQQQNCPHNEQDLQDWNSLFPSARRGQDINIDGNTRVVLRESVPTILGVITIPETSELIIGENSNGITLDVEGINVRGSLTIGSETCRIVDKVTITLHGSRPVNAVTNVRDPTYKGISVLGGTISLHGKRYYQTWTRLAATVQPGASFLRLQEDVNWEPNQEIVLVSTAMKDSKDWHQNEQLRVQSVDNSPSVGCIVYLQSQVSFKHVGIQAYQGEVGLLTRTILIQGAADDSEPWDSEPRVCTGQNNYGSQDAPCPNTDLTGFGGHIIVHEEGRGYVEGVELFRMGQTNVLGRYPIHFHLLNDCPECYFRDSSIHRSYYRCISIHGTSYMAVSENVAYDVTGYCYYLEDGVEEYNKLHFNLVAHVHMIGPQIPTGGGQQTQIFSQSDDLTLPADVSASGFYITNIRNELIGNAASGGWSGFAFPVLPTPLGSNRDVNMRPSSVMPLEGNQLDSNTAHSSGWYWYHAGAFYFGGSLYYVGDKLEYNPGRSFNFNDHTRNTCAVDLCAQGDCAAWCDRADQAFVRLTNSKAFLVPSVGINSWSGRMEILGYECHDCGLSIEALESGFWIHNMLAQCRTGEPISLPPSAGANQMAGDGFVWYDTDQEHIITDSTFRNCGIPIDGGGCDGSVETGCHTGSSVFSFLTHSSQFNPEIMQGTRDITLENCGRRFLMADYRGPGYTSVSGRLQNWLDTDGSVTGFGVPSVIASAVDNGMWWQPDLKTVSDPEGPVHMFRLNGGPERGLGHFRLMFDEAKHKEVEDGLTCTNGGFNDPCPALGYIKHAGPMFAGDDGLPLTAQADIAGPAGGFAWLLKLNEGGPRQLRVDLIEVGPDNPIVLQIAYPPGTSFDIFAFAPYCGNGGCQESFSKVGSAEEVRNSLGNTYHMSSEGLLSVRIVQFSTSYIGGDKGWILPDYSDTLPWDSDSYLLDRFERSGVRLPRMEYGPYVQITANCGGDVYCNKSPPDLNPDPCPSGYSQVAFDKCCMESTCICANGAAC